MRKFNLSSLLAWLLVLKIDKLGVQAACTSKNYSLTAMLCDMTTSNMIGNDDSPYSSFCMCPLEVADLEIYAFFTETVRANAPEIVKRAA